MEKDDRRPVEDNSLQNASLVEKRAALRQLHSSLPTYGSTDFWQRLEEYHDGRYTLPLELLVKVLREEALAREDKQAQRRLFEIIIARLQAANEQWVNRVLAGFRLLPGERHALAADLYADLCEQLLRALIDRGQHFWEEAFYHALRFARKHVRESFLRREGHWQKRTPGPGFRVPRTLLESLERAEWRAPFEEEWDIPDERAQQAFLQVEQVDLLLCLPVELRVLVWLIFWEGCSMRLVAELLGISDRTVRNRLRTALTQLRKILMEEQEAIDGESA